MGDDRSDGLDGHKVVSSEEWTAARKALLASEKEFTRRRDELTRQRRELPWERVDKEYVFEAPNGKVTLGDLFGQRSQLVVYHFMFSPEWMKGVRTARSGPTISTVSTCISVIVT